jgi:hypothetical protein
MASQPQTSPNALAPFLSPETGVRIPVAVLQM